MDGDSGAPIGDAGLLSRIRVPNHLKREVFAGVVCALGTGSGGGTPLLPVRPVASLVCWRMLAPLSDGRNNRAVDFMRDEIWVRVHHLKKELTEIFGDTNGYGGSWSFCLIRRISWVRGERSTNFLPHAENVRIPVPPSVVPLALGPNTVGPTPTSLHQNQCPLRSPAFLAFYPPKRLI